MKKIFNIHNHSTYSIFDGVSTPEDWAKYIADHKDEFYQGISLSEHGVLNGGYETFNFAQKNNLKYVPSIEFYVVPNGTDLTEKKVERYHLLVLGLDLEGYKQIVRINNMAIKRKQYILSRTGKFFVCITPDILEEVVKNNQGHLLCFGACIQGYWNKPVTELNNDLAKERLIEMIEIFGDENVFLESQTYDSPEQKMVNKFNKEIENEVGLKCVITSDAHIIRKEDKIYQILATIMLLKNNLAGYNAMLAKDDREMEYRSWYKNYNELLYDIENLDLGLNKNDLDRYCDTLSDLYEKIDPNINLRNEQKFIYGDGNQDENLDKFYNLIYNGWKERFGDKEMDDKYYKRLEYEMNIIKDKGFVDYFLEVRGIIQLGLKNDIIFGVGRGSAASSLISYLLEITNIDPLKYGLIFERFITPSRKDYPDIDCLTENTIIKTENGLKKIIDVQIGERVYDINNELKLVEDKSVRNIRKDEILYKIYFELDGEIGFCIVSENHKFFFCDKIKQAKDVELNDFILTNNKNNAMVVGIEKLEKNFFDKQEIKLVDIQVEDSKSFQINLFKL